MELSVHALVGLLNATDAFHNVQRAHEVNVNLAGVAHKAEDGGIRAHRQVNAQALLFYPFDKVVQLARFVILFYDNNHNCSPIRKMTEVCSVIHTYLLKKTCKKQPILT
jgi:hypothetical protein